ncbi:uncharacterized protein [Clytia hemisphaerica]|uniref:uncharacterized protein n=1 Tax=Clytia hemisphaerica TaxID=252671 RepID=UPI0034D70710
MNNRRGIFLTSVVGKVFEKVLLQKVTKDIKIDKHQNGEVKGRSTKDNWLALMAVMDMNRQLKRNTYVLFADAEKCFDKLWMEDCVTDIVENGLREREAMLLYTMNRNAQMKVRTPCGDTETFNIEKVVKQGTIFGPILCCSSTSKIIELGEPTGMIVAPNTELNSLIYVDDIAMAGRRTDVEKVGHKLRLMEDEKKIRLTLTR